ncbi:unnamed protein product [Pieris macdunnoughi]|uniref:Uncharacterized protein n=1 Tax=Pieris macdunnoughi TaxID=345717 RepID=A0A821RD61_9NEOP|nr:unnamed protein product [Pieris macdunnoughi]
MPDLTELHVSRAIALLEEGRTMRYVGNDLGVAPSVIYRLWKRYRETGEYSQGVVKVEREKLHVCKIATSSTVLYVTAPQLRSTKYTKDGYWCRNFRPDVLFTDESRFRLTRCDGRLRVYRRPGERYSAAAVQEYDKFGCGSVMVWGGVSLDERTDLVVVPGRLCAQTYIENVLEDHVWPAAYGMGPDFLLMQDNARPHTAAITRIRKRPIAPQTLQQLTEALIEEWERIPQEDIRRIIRSMPRRCQAVIRAHGGHTRY